MGYDVFLHRIRSERVPGQVCGIRIKDHDTELEYLNKSAEDIKRLCPDDAAWWGFDAAQEVRRHLKRAKRDENLGVTYFPTVFWNAERFSPLSWAPGDRSNS